MELKPVLLKTGNLGCYEELEAAETLLADEAVARVFAESPQISEYRREGIFMRNRC